jgi:hypothetical protein
VPTRARGSASLPSFGCRMSSSGLVLRITPDAGTVKTGKARTVLRLLSKPSNMATAPTFAASRATRAISSTGARHAGATGRGHRSNRQIDRLSPDRSVQRIKDDPAGVEAALAVWGL